MQRRQPPGDMSHMTKQEWRCNACGNTLPCITITYSSPKAFALFDQSECMHHFSGDEIKRKRKPNW